MKTKRSPECQPGAVVGSRAASQPADILSQHGRAVNTVSYYPGKGVMLNRGGSIVAGRNAKLALTTRGAIKGWSFASRHRMREFMLTHTVPDGWALCGATFTIPGPTLPGETERSLWKDWARRAADAGWCAVWRLELQRRGSRHWHLLVGVPRDGVPSDSSAARPRYAGTGSPITAIVESWHDSVRRLGPFTFDPPYVLKGDAVHVVSDVGSLMALPGSYEYSARVDQDGGRGAWLRYLQDHASKAKQDQSAESKGRQWGIVGRRHFVESSPLGVDRLTDRQYAAFLRSFQRLCTPSCKKPGVPFGRHLGYRPSRGRRGKSVWFSRVETVRRLAAWAASLPG